MKVTSLVKKAMIIGRKYEGEMWMVAGFGFGLMALYSTFKAARRVDQVLDECKKEIEAVHLEKPESTTENKEEYRAYSQKVTIAYGKMFWRVGSLFIAPAISAATCAGLIVKGNKVQVKRIASLAGLLASNYEEFRAYRKQVVEDHGEEYDQHLAHGLEKKAVTVDDPTNPEKKSTENVYIYDRGRKRSFSPWAREFEKGCTDWSPLLEYNEASLRDMENYFTMALKRDGVVIVNDIYRKLRIPKKKWPKDGFTYGWVYDKNHPENYKNMISLGIHRVWRGDGTDPNFDTGYEPVTIIDFDENMPIYILSAFPGKEE